MHFIISCGMTRTPSEKWKIESAIAAPPQLHSRLQPSKHAALYTGYRGINAWCFALNTENPARKYYLAKREHSPNAGNK